MLILLKLPLIMYSLQAISLFLLGSYYTYLGNVPAVAVSALLLYVGCYQVIQALFLSIFVLESATIDLFEWVQLLAIQCEWHHDFLHILLAAVTVDLCYLLKSKQQPLLIFNPAGIMKIISLDIVNVRYFKNSVDRENSQILLVTGIETVCWEKLLLLIDLILAELMKRKKVGDPFDCYTPSFHRSWN